jgi:hypothetical protein
LSLFKATPTVSAHSRRGVRVQQHAVSGLLRRTEDQTLEARLPNCASINQGETRGLIAIDAIAV